MTIQKPQNSTPGSITEARAVPGHRDHRPPEIRSTVETIYRLHERLARSDGLQPSPQINALFNELVSLATRPVSPEFAHQVLAQPEIQGILPQLQQLCAEGETQLERSWSRYIAGATDSRYAMRQFPHYVNYQRLTQLEFHAVTGLAEPPLRRIAIIGSGPLPLTSLLLARDYHQAVDNFDIDAEATDLAKRLAGTLGMDGLRFFCADVLSATDLADYDLVLLAAMVGSSRADKTAVIQHLYTHMAPGALVLARSAHSLRTLLYPRLGIEDLDGFVPLAELHPHTDVVNSAVVARKPVEPARGSSEEAA